MYIVRVTLPVNMSLTKTMPAGSRTMLYRGVGAGPGDVPDDARLLHFDDDARAGSAA
jgi:hypothetical protein